MLDNDAITGAGYPYGAHGMRIAVPLSLALWALMLSAVLTF